LPDQPGDRILRMTGTEDNMALEFPLARLFVYEQLMSNGFDCTSAMVNAAYRFGLAPPGRLHHLKGLQDPGACGSLSTAKKIVTELLTKQDAGNSGERLAEKIMQSLESDVLQYKRKACPQHGTQERRDPASCALMAPIVFDLLLKHLRPYI